EIWTLTVGGIAHQYVTQSGDQLTDVALALATAFGLTTTTATISFASLTAATIQLSVSGKSPAGGVRVTGTPTPAMASSINWTNVRVAFPTILRPGEQWSVELLGPGSTKATHTVTGADTATSVAAALVTAFGSATGYTISASAGVLDVSRTTSFRSAVTVTASGSGAAGSAHSHTVTLAPQGEAGTWRLSLAGTTAAQVAAQIAGLANANPDLVATSSGAVVTIVALVSGVTAPSLSKTNGNTTTAVSGAVATVAASLLTVNSPVVSGQAWNITL